MDTTQIQQLIERLHIMSLGHEDVKIIIVAAGGEIEIIDRRIITKVIKGIEKEVKKMYE